MSDDLRVIVRVEVVSQVVDALDARHGGNCLAFSGVVAGSLHSAPITVPFLATGEGVRLRKFRLSGVLGRRDLDLCRRGER